MRYLKVIILFIEGILIIDLLVSIFPIKRACVDLKLQVPKSVLTMHFVSVFALMILLGISIFL
jgi:hypothetical protein